MAEKQTLDGQMKLFLVTQYPTVEQHVFNTHYTVPPIGISFPHHGLGSFPVQRNNEYLSGIVKNQLGLQVFIYEVNCSDIIEYLRRLNFDGLIVPVGHGDINTLSNLGYSSPDQVGIPVFEAHRHLPGYRGYTGPLTNSEIAKMDDSLRNKCVHDAFTAWVIEHFKS